MAMAIALPFGRQLKLHSVHWAFKQKAMMGNVRTVFQGVCLFLGAVAFLRVRESGLSKIGSSGDAVQSLLAVQRSIEAQRDFLLCVLLLVCLGCVLLLW